MEEEIIISPIFYMGSKKKLIKKGLIDLFPKDINMFVDLFAGSGIVSMNIKARKYVVNDIDENLFALYYMFKNIKDNDIIDTINTYIDNFGLAREGTKRNEFKDKEKITQYKKSYNKLRDDYNFKDKNIIKFYTLMFYSFSQQFRVNSKGKFNMPCGNNYFSNKNATYIENGCKFFSDSNVAICNNDFRELGLNELSSQDFVYLDPPYFNTTATYNENGGWQMQDEIDLFNMCEQLNKNNIKWGMSNVFMCKGKENTHLIEWCDRNNWNVYTFDKFTYSACGKGNSNAQEVFICNY